MIQYARFSIECTSKRREEKNIYQEFKRKLNDYLLDEDMELYRVPILSDEYIYAREIASHYSWDWNQEEDRDDYPGLYIEELGQIETVYSKQDFNNGVAYMVNFWNFAYTYDDVALDDYLKECCCAPKWKYENGLIQYKPLLIPSSEIKKKKCAKLHLGYAINKDVVSLLTEHELAQTEDFLEVKDKRGEVVAYQISPQHLVTGFAIDNNMRLVDKCINCGLERYEYDKEPFYINERLLGQLQGLNCTTEVTGPIIERYDENLIEKKYSIVEPWYIINKEVYTLLNKKYPKMQFIPIFMK